MNSGHENTFVSLYDIHQDAKFAHREELRRAPGPNSGCSCRGFNASGADRPNVPLPPAYRAWAGLRLSQSRSKRAHRIVRFGTPATAAPS